MTKRQETSLLRALARLHGIQTSYVDVGRRRVVASEETLRALHDRFGLALITNGLEDVQRPRLERSTIGGCFDAVVISEEVGAAKPDPAIFQRVCNALGCAPGEVVFVGDSKRCDVDGPRAFGMQARHLDRRGGQTLLDVLAEVL